MANQAILDAPVSQREYVVGFVVSNGFRFCHADGWFYPAHVEHPLMRVGFDHLVHIERREDPMLGWTDVAMESYECFDTRVFEDWVDSRPLAA